jgi:glutathione synthase/RimK-type ligase-like ATP-grasp enzyme
MVLIVTHKKDYTADFVINKLNQQGLAYRRLNCEDLVNSKFAFQIERDFEFEFGQTPKFNSGWFRRTKLPSLNIDSEEERHYLLAEYDALVRNVLNSVDCKWLSEPYRIYRAENKTLQLREAKEIGLNVPATIITNDKSKIKAFYKRYNKNIIVKPIARNRIDYSKHSGFIFTNKVNSGLIASIEEFDINPCIFQENIDKDCEIRATVVGDQIFAAVCYSQKQNETRIDWRRSKLTFEKIDLPKEVAQMCIALTKKLHLRFGAIDLIKTKKGEYCFLEINPNGQWAWIELQTGQNIAEAIIEILYGQNN